MRYLPIVFSVLLLFNGCSASRQIVELDDYLPDSDRHLPQHETVQSVLNHYFTDEAIALIRDIPLIDGPAFSGYAAGTTFFSNVASLLTFNGIGRKVIMPRNIIKEHGVEGIIHEYVHHIDDIVQDDDLSLFDRDAFLAAYKKMRKDFKYAGIAIYVENQLAYYGPILQFFAPHFPEIIAYTIARIAISRACPDDMKDVLSKIIKF